MSNEITYTGGVKFSKATVTEEMAIGVRQADLTGEKFVRGQIALTTAYELIPLAEITAPGWYCLENVGTQDIEVAPALTGPAHDKIKPGQSTQGRFATTTPAVKASASTSKLRYFIVED